MTNKKLTKDEIKIALKHCANIHCICSDCILFKPDDDDCNCSKQLKLATLDLINQYEAEIERLEDAKNAYKDIVDTCEIGAIKEFAKRLKNDLMRNHYYCEDIDIEDWIDDLLKEMGVE